ncbi:MAG: glucose-6-phosphate isomerase [Oscillospiraceae bacterium]|nr:glucose-6-phosphate isomerase [Oscillospiraceae bacterium]
MIKLDLSGVSPFLEKSQWQKTEQVGQIHDTLVNNYGVDYDFTTWMNLPETYDKDEFRRIKQAAEKIKSEADVLLVIGVGGSYLGARAGIELLRSPNYNLTSKYTPNIYFVGNNLSAEHINEIGHLLKDKNFSINVVSKSGGTLEPGIAFRVFKNFLESRYGDIGAKGRIYVTTDRGKGSLRKWADKEGFESFKIPDRIGGRYSILTAAGLLPMATAGIDIDKVMAGAFEAMKTYLVDKSFDNPVWQYAAVRQALYAEGRNIEVLASFEPAFRFMAEWWRQLFGESEGKSHGGIFPSSVDFSADLHAMGQYLQDGSRNLMETVVSFDSFRRDIKVPPIAEDYDGLNYLAGRSVDSINQIARQATVKAHVDGGVPVMGLSLPDMSDTAFGWLVYFFQFSAALSASIQGVNPFDQPGVEAYKANMFRLLGKPE